MNQTNLSRDLEVGRFFYDLNLNTFQIAVALQAFSKGKSLGDCVMSAFELTKGSDDESHSYSNEDFEKEALEESKKAEMREKIAEAQEHLNEIRGKWLEANDCEERKNSTPYGFFIRRFGKQPEEKCVCPYCEDE